MVFGKPRENRKDKIAIIIPINAKQNDLDYG